MKGILHSTLLAIEQRSNCCRIPGSGAWKKCLYILTSKLFVKIVFFLTTEAAIPEIGILPEGAASTFLKRRFFLMKFFKRSLFFLMRSERTSFIIFFA